MSDCILIDTDVLVDYLRDYNQAVSYVTKHADQIILSPIVIAELYAGVKGDAELKMLDDLVSLFRVAPVTPEIARTGGLLKRDFGKSHGVGLGDAILAATAQSQNANLGTLNVKHYPMVLGLAPAYVKR